MIRRFLTLSLLTIASVGVMYTAPVSAVTGDPCDMPNPPASCNRPATSNPNSFTVDASPLPHTDASSNTFQAGLRIVFTIIGALSLLMVTIGGFKYITSQGDSQEITKAKDTIIYALVGVVVSICAVAIVTFVLGKT